MLFNLGIKFKNKLNSADINIVIYVKRNILFIALILVIFIISIAYLPSLLANSGSSLVAQATNVVESRDYATEVLGDPWDMSNASDMTPHIKRLTNISMSGGTWNATTTSPDPQFWFLWAGYPGAYAVGKNGSAHPVNSSLYKRLSFRMYIGTSNTSYRRGQFYWFTRADLKGAKVLMFYVYPGWHTYQLDLPSTWSGWPVSLRLDPIDRANTPIKIDWIRLTNKPGSTTSLTWTDSASGNATIYTDNDVSGYDGSSLSFPDSIVGNNSESVDLDGLNPDNYYFYVKNAAGSNSSYSVEPTVVNRAPFIKITEPDETGGKDWATSTLHNPWDMKSGKDINLIYNVIGSSFRRGIYSGVNSNRARNGKSKNDPYIMLNLGRKTIDANRFHLLTFRYKYSGSFSLGRGTMSRFGWTTKRYNDPRYWQMTDDLVTYSGWNTITVDLKKIKMNRGSHGWKGRITRFRFDPHEDLGTRRFYVNDISLREYDRLSSSFNIKYSLTDDNANTDLTIYRDLDKTFGNGNESVITTLTTSSGNKSYLWTPSGSIKGLFWIYIKADDGINTSGYYSSGPLRVH